MPNGDCPTGTAHSQQIRLLEENVERIDHCLLLKAETAHLARIEAKVDKIVNMFWTLVMLIIANLAGIIVMLLKMKV